MSQKILVTGSTGNIGNQILKNLDALHVSYIAGINSGEIKEGQVFVDYDNEESLIQAFSGMDTVFLLFPMHSKMVEWAENAVNAAKKADVKHLVRSSGAGANSGSSFFMPGIQGQIDDRIRKSGIPYTITMPASFMQNFINFFGQDIRNGEVYQPVGEGKIAWVDVRDIAAVNAQILISPERFANQNLTITGSENLSYREALGIVAETIDQPVAFIDVPSANANAAMKEYGMPQFNIDMMSSLNEIIKAGYAEGTTTVVHDITGKEPISFLQFTHDYKSAWQ